MDEQHYRQTYHQVNQLRCVFEKAINSRICACSLAHRFNLADREGVACQVDLAHKRCLALLAMFRDNANFALGLPKIDSPLPHNKEVKIQIGGLLGLQQALPQREGDERVADIQQLLTRSIEQFGTLEKLPFAEIVKSIVNYQIRKKRRSG